MAAETYVRFISTSIIKPTSVDKLNQRVQLTPWDIDLLQLHPIQMGLLFNKPTSQQEKQLRIDNYIDHLKTSLSMALNIFYPLAGRLAMIKNDDDNTTSFFIDCNGIGAQFVHAIADGVRVSDILEPIYVPNIVNSFFLLNGDLNRNGISQPLLSVQVTELVDGIFIGCTINHMVLDGSSFWHFFNTWSDISCNSSHKTSQPLPIFDRSFLSELFHFPIRIANFPEPENIEDLVNLSSLRQRVFHFPKEKIAEFKKRANDEMGTDKISSLQALLAVLWRSVNRTKSLDNNQVVTFALAVGLRKRMQPSLPECYAGVAISAAVTSITIAELLGNGLGWVSWQINQAIATQTTAEVEKEHLENWTKSPSLLTFSIRLGKLFLANSHRFNVYGNDFGWGKPLAARSGVTWKYDGHFTVFPGKEEGSIDFELCLSAKTLEDMEGDIELLEALGL